MKKVIISLITVSFLMISMVLGVGCKEEAPPAEETEPAEEVAEEVTEEPAIEEVEAGQITFLAYELQNAVNILYDETFKKMIPEMGFEYNIMVCDSKADVQVQQLETAITTDPAVIILVPVEPSTLIDPIAEARDNGIIVEALAAEARGGYCDMTSILGVQKIGQLGAEQIIERIEERKGKAEGKVFQLMGDTSSGYTVGIKEGFDEIIAGYPDIELTTKDNPNWNAENAVNLLSDQLTATKDYDAIFIHADSFVPMMVPVLEELGYSPGDIIFGSTDGDPGALDNIREGWLDFTVAFSPPALAEGTLFFLDDLLAGNEVREDVYDISGINDVPLVNEEWGPTLYFPGIIITKDNVDDPTLWGNVAAEMAK